MNRIRDIIAGTVISASSLGGVPATTTQVNQSPVTVTAQNDASVNSSEKMPTRRELAQWLKKGGMDIPQFRIASRRNPKDAGLFKLFDEIAVRSQEVYPGARQPGIAAIVVADSVNGGNPEVGSYHIVYEGLKNNIVVISEASLKAAIEEQSFAYGHEWGHALVHHNRGMKDDLLKPNVEYGSLVSDYKAALVKIIGKTRLPKPLKAEVTEEIIDRHLNELSADRISTLLSCRPEDGRKFAAGTSSPKTLDELSGRIDAINKKWAGRIARTHNKKDRSYGAQQISDGVRFYTHPVAQQRGEAMDTPFPGCNEETKDLGSHVTGITSSQQRER